MKISRIIITGMSRHGRIICTVCGATTAVLLALVVAGARPPADFPTGKILTIDKGMTIGQAAERLAAEGAVRSAFIYKAYTTIASDGKGIKAGDYLFAEPLSVFTVSHRTIQGVHGIAQVKVLIPEGLASSDIGRLLAKNLPGIQAKDFAVAAKQYEGKLFPDTYFFYENMTTQEVIDTMRANFDAKTRGMPARAKALGRSFEDVLTMASIVEEEATSTADRRIIAGILWKRIEKKMPLQVDPPFFYLLGKTSAELTRTDLATKSPYNTYKNLGLPPTPIDNPSLNALEAALDPEPTKYYFYLSGKDGKMYYAATYDGHLINKEKHLD